METKVDWDDNIPKDILQLYQQWLSELHHVKEISVSRWFGADVDKKKIKSFIYIQITIQLTVQ